MTIPLTTDYRGLRTSIDPLSVGDGYLTRGLNIRNADGVASLRGGMTLVDAASPATGTYAGGAFFEYDGNVNFLFAMDNGATDVRIYRSVYSSGSWSGPSEVSAASGQYGATRMNRADSGFVTFTGVPGIYGTKYVIAQNGKDAPRVITLGSSVTVAKNEDIAAPTQSQGYKPVFTIADYLAIETAAPTVTATTAADWTAALSGSSWIFTVQNTPIATDNVVIHNTPTVDLSGSEQVCFMLFPTVAGYGPSDQFLLTNFKIELRDSSGNFYVIHDPANGVDNAFTAIGGDSTFQFVYFPVGEHTSVAAMDNINGLRVSFVEADPFGGATLILTVAGIFATGRIPFGAQYALSYENVGTGAESPSVALENPTTAERMSAVADGASLLSVVIPPLVPGVYYTVKVPTFAPPTADRDKGVDYINIYRKDPEDEYFYYVGQDQVSAYSGSWAYASPYSTTVNRATFTDNVYRWAKDTTKTAPGAYVENIPVGQAGAYSGDRMYFNSRGSASSRPSVKVSDQKFPFRFRSLPLSGEDTLEGYEAVLDGERDVTAVIPASSSTLGGGGVYVFTKRGIYTVDNYFISKIASAGCLGAVAEEDTNIWFFDRDKQVRVMGGGIGNLSRYTVHDKFSGVSDPSRMSFARFQGRLYCLVSGTRVMVWSDRLGDWESEDVPDASLVPAQFLKWDFYGESKLYVAMTDGDLYEYESGTTDGGAQIPFGMTWPEMHLPGWTQMSLGKPYIVCTDKASETASFVFTAKNPAATATATVNLDAPSGETVAWSKGASSGKDVAVRGCSVTPKIDLTVEGPFKLYAVTVEGDYRGRGAGG